MAEQVNGIHDGATPLHINIAGAGIGGLCAAIGLRQQGHHVAIYEKTSMAQETGAAIHIAPNCFGLLKRLGMDPRNHGSVEFKGLTQYDECGRQQQRMDLNAMNRKMWQHPWELIHRAHLHSALKELAASPNGKGSPVELHLSAAVESVDAATATITLKNGSTAHGDVVIGADGVHSVCRKAIPGGDCKPFDSGKSAFRFLIPTEELAQDEQLGEYLQSEGHLVMWVAEDRRLVMYPCVSGTQMNFVAIHPSAESSTQAGSESWQQLGSKAQMLKIFNGFGDKVAALLSHVDESRLKIWTLLDMAQMPHFFSDRLAIIGDAAHPFLPRKERLQSPVNKINAVADQAQGGAQAIEDAMSLAALLPLGTTPEDIPERLQLYENQRYERSHQIQEFTRLSGADLSKGQNVDMQRFTAYNVGYDEWDASTQALEKHLAQKEPGSRWRTPIGFGPAPGPRLPLGFQLHSAEVARIQQETPESGSTLIIRFKSSRTFLQGLFPPGSNFSFQSPATICEATLLCNTLDGMTWLGGGGYNFVMLCIHGVKYTKRDGSEMHGTFLPLLFEDFTDPIVTGRDDLGMPKLYAAIDVQHHEDAATVKLSWRGSEFGVLKLSGLVSQKTLPEQPSTNGAPSPHRGPPAPIDQGQFAWRFVPAVGQPGKADVEYPTFVPKPDPTKFGTNASVSVAKDASFDFQALDWKRLPTLHNVVRVLAEIPNYGIVEAKHVRSIGMDDLSSAYRIE